MSHYPFFGDPAVYVDPVVVSFVADPAIAEVGSTVDAVSLRWSLSKTPLTLMLDGGTIYLNDLCARKAGPFTTSQSWALKMSDAEQSASGKATLRFLNKAYWGNVSAPPASSGDILALENSYFATAFKNTIQYGSPSGKFPCFAFPARFGAPRNVQIGTPNTIRAPATVWAAFTDFTTATVSFTNASGYVEDYTVLTFNAVRNDSSLLIEWN